MSKADRQNGEQNARVIVETVQYSVISFHCYLLNAMYSSGLVYNFYGLITGVVIESLAFMFHRRKKKDLLVGPWLLIARAK